MQTVIRQRLHLADALEKRAEVATPVEKSALLQKKTLVEADAFVAFKTANWSELAPYLKTLGGGLALGTGVSIPLLGAGHLFLRSARRNAEDAVRDARNQAVLTALGIGGLQQIGKGLNSFMQPDTLESTTENFDPSGRVYKTIKRTKVSAVLDDLAAVLQVDKVLEDHYNATQDKIAGECLIENRARGARLLRELF